MPLPFEFGDLIYQPLSEDCPREAFSCGDETVDAWFHEYAHKRHGVYKHRTTVVMAPGDECPVAFFTFSTRTVKQGVMSKALNENFFHTLSGEQFPVISLDWLGVREELRTQKLGRHIMGRVLGQFYYCIDSFGTQAIILEAIDQKTEDFYYSLGFRRYGRLPTQRTMILGAKPVVALFKN